MGSTLREQLPDAALTVLLVDAPPDEVEPLAHGELLGVEAVAGEDHGLIAATNPPGALAFALLPLLMRVVLQAGGGSAVYIGAGQRIAGPLGAFRDLLAERQLALAARPRAAPRAPVVAEASPGAVSRELLGMRAGESTEELLGAWPRYFADDEDDGAAAVGDWLDAIPTLLGDVGVLRDRAYGIDTSSAPDGLAAQTIDFSALDPGDPLSWFEGPPPLSPVSAPALAQLAERQAAELRAAGWSDELEREIPFARLPGGLRLTATVRSLLLAAILDGELTRSPFDRAGQEELYTYLGRPDTRGVAAGLTRLHMSIWDRRADLQAAYPHIDGPDGAGYAGWLCVYGAEQEGLVPELMPPAPDLAYRDADKHVAEGEPRWGVNAVGFFTAELGVGEAARLLLSGLDAREIPALPIQGHLMPPSRQGVGFSYARPDEAPYPVNILCINGDGIPVFAREAGRSFFKGRYTVALWWWEAGPPPASWKAAYEFVDEVWVATQHIYDAIAPGSPVPVVRIRLPLVPPEVAPLARGQLGLPEEGYLFLCVHDYHSVARRKNPVAVIEAFRRAFPPGSGAKLVLKSINAPTHPAEHGRAVRAAGDHPDIVLVDEYVANVEKNAVIAACDCFVSLHRSEGFGISMAEAMLLGRPVIATRYGGVLEFMNEGNSYLVDWEPTVVGEGAFPYSPDAVWAEPDIDHAAALMRHVFAERAEAAARGEVARRELLGRHSPAAAGEIIERRLAVIRQGLAEAGVRSLNLSHLLPQEIDGGIRERIEHPPAFTSNEDRLGWLKQRMYHPVLRWVREYTKHQGGINIEAQLAIQRVDRRLTDIAGTLQDEQNARHAETLAVLREIKANRREHGGSDRTT
jgi:glycosyltransferase involved in cell wall biosynthesis